MNIFVDTCILLKDPFFQKGTNKELIELVNKMKIKIFISNIVIQELEKNYREIIQKFNKQLSNIIEDGMDYHFVDCPVKEIDEELSVKNLQEFYNNLMGNGLLTILDYDNNFLPEVISRSFKKLRPFSGNKKEYNDTLIWLTYSRYAETLDLQDCILLSDNVSDFGEQDKTDPDNFVIHPDLQKDSNRFKIYRSTNELFREEIKKLQSKSLEFSKWLSSQPIDNDYVFNLLKKNFEINIQNKVTGYLESKDLTYFYVIKDNTSQNVSVSDINIGYCNNISIQNFDNKCMISCNLQGRVYISGYNNRNNTGWGTAFSLRLKVSFFYDSTEIPTDFCVESIEM